MTISFVTSFKPARSPELKLIPKLEMFFLVKAFGMTKLVD